MEKVYILVQESNVDGENLVNVTPCATMEIAQARMQKEYQTLLNESHFAGMTEENDDDYTLEITDTSIYLSDNCDDYSEHLHIEEKEICKV